MKQQSTKTPKDFYTASGFLLHHSNYLQQSVLGMAKVSGKSRDLFIEWIKSRAVLLDAETNWKDILSKDQNSRSGDEQKFIRSYEFGYELGDVILVDLGYNVGHEYGGAHFCIVMKKSKRTEKGVIVLPLTSSNPGDNEFMKQQHFNLGELSFLNTNPRKPNKTSYAKLGCMLQVSKLRIMNNRKIKGKLAKPLFRALEEELIGYLSPYFKHEYQKNIKGIEKVTNQLTELEQKNLELLQRISELESSLKKYEDPQKHQENSNVEEGE